MTTPPINLTTAAPTSRETPEETPATRRRAMQPRATRMPRETNPRRARATSGTLSLLGQVEADVEFAKLLLRHCRRRAHHQILGALVHRKQRHLAQVLLPAEQHYDTVDPRCDATVRRRAERQSAQHPAELR